jgi:hypothetical protein
MVAVPLTTPYTMSTATLTLGVDDYTAAVSQAIFTPSVSLSTWRGIGGNQLTFPSPATWTLDVAIAQDLAPAGLLRYLLDHAGEEVDATLTPLAAEDPITAKVILSPGAIGGTADGSAAVATISLGVQGVPSFVVAAAATSTPDVRQADQDEVLEYDDLTTA